MGKIKAFFRNKWVGIHPGKHSIHSVVRRLDGQPSGCCWAEIGHLRPLHHAVISTSYVWRHNAEMCQRSKTYKAVYEWVNAIIFATVVASLVHIFFFQMYVIPIVVDGEVAAGGRLPLREQGGLRSPDAQHAGGVPVRTPYDAFLADQKIVLRERQMALPPPQGTGPNRAQRRGGIQLPGRRHGAARAAGRYLLRRAAANISKLSDVRPAANG